MTNIDPRDLPDQELVPLGRLAARIADVTREIAEQYPYNLTLVSLQRSAQDQHERFAGEAWRRTLDIIAISDLEAEFDGHDDA